MPIVYIFLYSIYTIRCLSTLIEFRMQITFRKLYDFICNVYFFFVALLFSLYLVFVWAITITPTSPDYIIATVYANAKLFAAVPRLTVVP